MDQSNCVPSRHIGDNISHHTDQSYCVPGRQIGDNISLILDVLDFLRAVGLNAGLISIDEEKAFDQVEHQYLYVHFGGFWFQLWFYCHDQGDIESVLKVNGGLSAPQKKRVEELDMGVLCQEC